MKKQYTQWVCDNCGKQDRLWRVDEHFISSELPPWDKLPDGWLHYDLPHDKNQITRLNFGYIPVYRKQFCCEACKQAWLVRVSTPANMVGI